MNKQFVLIFRMHNQLIDLITFKLLLPYLEEVVDIEVTLSDVDVPYTNVTS